MLNERDILADVIKDERFLNVNLAFCAVEASPQLKPTLVDLMREEQDLHSRLFQFAATRGWYPTLWGDLGYQQTGAFPTQPTAAQGYGVTPAYGTQAFGVPQAYGATQGYGAPQPFGAAAAPVNWALGQQPAFARQQAGQVASGWQQPTGTASWQQTGWQQPQPYNSGIAAAGQYRPGTQTSPAFGQYGTQQAAAQFEIAGREYGPY